jgi:hypothetical protein
VSAQQVGVADDGVQRGAQFVREDGQEFVLHAVGLLRRPPGLPFVGE